MNLNIDIVNACNLDCPSCPRGRGDLHSDAEQMSPGLLRQILDKASKEMRITCIQMYDATEPTLHKDLPTMIRVARPYGRVVISTNAAVPRVDWRSILMERPHQIIVSISGACQEMNERGHVKAKWDVILQAVNAISLWHKYLRSTTDLLCLYHRYVYNLGAEEDRARAIMEPLGFQFAGVWASHLAPDNQTFNRAECVIGPEQARMIGKNYPLKDGRSCLVLARNLNIDHRGQATMCAGFHHVVRDFLTTPFEDIQNARVNDPVCRKCSAAGMAHYVCRFPRLDYFACKIAGDSWRYRMDRYRHWAFHWKEWLTR